MAIDKKTLQAAANWVLPPNIFRALTQYRPKALYFSIAHSDVIARNHSLKNRHAGERCFILCNGPSVKMQNIKPLKNETVFSVSSGYLHPDYAEIAPRYHCVPQLTYSEKMTPKIAVDWFTEMHSKLGHAELFLDCQEYDLVQKNRLFGGRDIHFLCMGKNHFPNTSTDLTGIIPRSQSVPVMALMIALYMGFKEIYLLGVDHDWFVKKEYHYFYEPGLLKDKDSGVGPGGIIESKLYDDLPMITKLWGQYRAIAQLAKARGVQIYNATHGGMLDEFPRVRLEDIAK